MEIKKSWYFVLLLLGLAVVALNGKAPVNHIVVGPRFLNSKLLKRQGKTASNEHQVYVTGSISGTDWNIDLGKTSLVLDSSFTFLSETVFYLNFPVNQNLNQQVPPVTLYLLHCFFRL